MNRQLENDLSQLDSLLDKVKTRAVNFLQALNDTPVSRSAAPPSIAGLPDTGDGLEKAMELFFSIHAGKLVSSAGPRYWGFVTGGVTPAALAGDWLTGVFDQNPQSAAAGGDVSAAIELETIALLRQLFGLPETFNGGFVSGATMANFTGLAVGRQWAGLRGGNDIARNGMTSPVSVLAAIPHSSAIKCLAMLGIGSANVTLVKTLSGNREAIDLDALEEKLKNTSGSPVILLSSGGTVNTVDFDDMQGIARLRERYPFFWHVDAAFGGFAACSPAHRHLLQGWETADSIAIDCHKWLNVPYDSAFYLVQEKHATLQVQTFQNSNAPYLGNPEEQFSFLNFGPDNSRRLRALPVWFSLMAYGREGFRSIVENNIRLARLFGERIEAETGFTLAAPVRLNVVCFTAKTGKGLDPTATYTRLNAGGKVFITPTQYNGVACLRAAFVNWRTTNADLDVAIEEINKT